MICTNIVTSTSITCNPTQQHRKSFIGNIYFSQSVTYSQSNNKYKMLSFLNNFCTDNCHLNKVYIHWWKLTHTEYTIVECFYSCSISKTCITGIHIQTRRPQKLSNHSSNSGDWTDHSKHAIILSQWTDSKSMEFSCGRTGAIYSIAQKQNYNLSLNKSYIL